MNLKLIEYALGSLARRREKNFFVLASLTLIIFITASVMFISSSLRAELLSAASSMPDITVQRINGGRQKDIPEKKVDSILLINGVSKSVPRYWGYYFFSYLSVNYTVMGMDLFAPQYKESLERFTEEADLSELSGDSVVVGAKLKKLIESIYGSDTLSLAMPDGSYRNFNIKGVFSADTALESSDMILMDKEAAKELLGLQEGYCTDIAVNVANPSEVDMVSMKITNMFPDVRVVLKKEIISANKSLFDYRRGLFLLVFSVTLLTFLVIVYDRASGLAEGEKKEIGVLKACGWRVGDVIAVKMYEALALSVSAFAAGVTAALFYVYVFDAPVISGLFTGYSLLRPDFELPFTPDLASVFLTFFATVPFYAASVIIPAWRAAVIDAGEVIR